MVRDIRDAVLAAHFNRRALSLQGADAVNEIFLDVVLLQVHKSRKLVAILGQQVEVIDLAIAEKHLADVPFLSLARHGMANTKAVGDFQRAFCKTDRTGAEAHLVIVVQYHDRNAGL